MSERFNQHTTLRDVSQSTAFHEGLRKYMLQVYNYMALGLGLTGGIALLVASSPSLQNALLPFTLFFIIAQLGVVFMLSARINTLKMTTAQTMFWVYAALNGVVFSSLFLAYTGESITRVFFITAGMFSALSLYGYTTKRDLTNLGAFLFMGFIGLVIASLVGLFWQSTQLQFLTSVMGVIIFTGFTIYDTQAIKESYVENASHEVGEKIAIFGALKLYLDFINLFLYLLRFLGEQRR